jgi:hypothetical protein
MGMEYQCDPMEPDEEGWSEWVHPRPGYLMQCCDCGLVHAMEFMVAASDDVIWPDPAAPAFNPGEGSDRVILFRASRAPDQPETDGLVAAIEAFRTLLPGWWYSLGDCGVSAHASCGPDRQGGDADLLVQPLFDAGFHADIAQPATIAEALHDVTEQGIAALAVARSLVARPLSTTDDAQGAE